MGRAWTEAGFGRVTGMADNLAVAAPSGLGNGFKVIPHVSHARAAGLRRTVLFAGGLEFCHGRPPIDRKVGVHDLWRPGKQPGQARDCRFEVVGVHMRLRPAAAPGG